MGQSDISSQSWSSSELLKSISCSILRLLICSALSWNCLFSSLETYWFHLSTTFLNRWFEWDAVFWDYLLLSFVISDLLSLGLGVIDGWFRKRRRLLSRLSIRSTPGWMSTYLASFCLIAFISCYTNNVHPLSYFIRIFGVVKWCSIDESRYLHGFFIILLLSEYFDLNPWFVFLLLSELPYSSSSSESPSIFDWKDVLMSPEITFIEFKEPGFIVWCSLCWLLCYLYRLLSFLISLGYFFHNLDAILNVCFGFNF